MKRQILVAALLAAAVAVPAVARLGGPSPISNFGRRLVPQGRVTMLGHFPVGAALTPDGRFLWTVGAGQTGRGVRITATSDASTVQTLDDPNRSGGIAISADGTRAYVSDTRDRIQPYRIDPATGQATALPAIDLPAAAVGVPADELPPRAPNRIQNYPEGLALSADGRTLVAAVNLSDGVAVIDTRSGSVQQVAVRRTSRPGDRAYPLGVAIAGTTAFVTDEGDGTLGVVPLAQPSAAHEVPLVDTAALGGVDAAKTHPSAIVASADGSRLYVALTNADRVLELDPANPSVPLRSFDVGRPEGLGTAPVGLALTRDGRDLFVANSGEGVVRVLDLQAGKELSRIPAGIYPDRVVLDEVNHQLDIVSMKGLGPGPTKGTGEGVANRIYGALQTLPLSGRPAERTRQIVADGKGGDSVPIPVDRRAAPGDSPLSGPNGLGPSPKIKYVFYVVMENHTFDQYLGDLGKGDGDPCLTVYGYRRQRPVQRDGRPCPHLPAGDDYADQSAANGRSPGQSMDGTPITPNFHRLADRFVTLDHLYADSETSDDGHLWTSGGYATDYALRNTQAPNRPFDVTLPISAPPRRFLFDSLGRQGISFFNYGEAVGASTLPDTQARPDELAMQANTLANSEFITQYPSSGAINSDPITGRLTYDHDPVVAPDPTKGVSRMHYFRQRFGAQLAACPDPSQTSACAVPRFNELLFPNNHGAGTAPGTRTPDALNRDGDQALGQLVSDISHSKIWPYSAIFVVQDDAQNGPDHVDGHRMAGLVLSPYVKHTAVVSRHYDQLSVLRTMEIILGMQPSYLYDALAAPMWDVFTARPDPTPYAAFDIPEALMNEKNVAGEPLASASRKQLWVADFADEGLKNRLDWEYRYGTLRGCPRAACALGTPAEVRLGHLRGRAVLAQLRASASILRDAGGGRLSPQELARRIEAAARRSARRVPADPG
jgi:DNA-binding beta-propeller fold protein YncE